MRSFVSIYLKKKSQRIKEVKEEKKKKKMMIYLCPTDCTAGSTSFSPGCFPNPCLSDTATSHKQERPTRTSTMATRATFALSTKSTIFPNNTQFTNHESLPSLQEAFGTFSDSYPQYGETQEADRIRKDEYSHLEGHVCLDYTGLSLFSHAQLHAPAEPSSSRHPQPPFFDISYKSTSLMSHVLYGVKETGMESVIRSRIMTFLNKSEEDYSMVCTANRTTAFRLLAEAYPFNSYKRMLTVYDYESEAVDAMADCASKRGAKVMSASFSWPSMRIQSVKLKKILSKRKKKRKGLLVFPLQSRTTGTVHPYFWMRLAQENGWHVLLDACPMGPKDMDTLGLSLIQPDFMICSFFKLVGENPTGFASLFLKKSSCAVLDTSVTSVGIVSIVPTRRPSHLADDFSGTTSDWEKMSSFSGPLPTPICDESDQIENVMTEDPKTKQFMELKCGGLDHADSLGLRLISCRLRCLTNWLVIALMKLQHPSSENSHALVRIYGPRVKFDRGPGLAFNVFDWKGEKVEPVLVQKLADRSNISLRCSFLRSICFQEKYEALRDIVLEGKACEGNSAGYRVKENVSSGIAVVNASLGFLSNFEDAYRLWSFVAKFLDADFVEKERWRYMALNQNMVEV